MPMITVITNTYLQRRVSIIAQGKGLLIQKQCAPPMQHVGHYQVLLRPVVKQKPVALHLPCQTLSTLIIGAQKRARGQIQSVAVRLAPIDK